MSAKRGAAISGITFNYVDANWNLRTFPLCLFDTEDMGKSAEEYEAIITAAVRDSGKLGSDVHVFSGASDSEQSVALSVDRYLNFSGAVRCSCHTLALAVNDAMRTCNFVATVVQRIYRIGACLNTHTKVGARFVELERVDFSRDRIVTLGKEFATRWQSKFNVLEKDMMLGLCLAYALPVDTPSSARSACS